MRVLIFTQNAWSIPLFSELLQKHQVLGIVTKKQGPKSNIQLLDFSKTNQIEILEWDNRKINEISEWVRNEKVQLGISFGFSYKIPKVLFECFEHGVVNIHFGKLPKYAGPDPLFWTIKNEEKILNLSFHRIDEDWDAGELLLEVPISLFPGEPYGLLASRVSIYTAQIFDEFLQNFLIHPGKKIPPNRNPLVKPSQSELTINWENQKADEIEALVNAANPSYGGAITIFRGNPIRVLEVSPANLDIDGIFTSGTIVYSDPNYGFFVICSDKNYLRLNILQLDGTIISGQKLSAMEIMVNEKLG
jgi:methionyl-tRNA formyltransferase